MSQSIIEMMISILDQIEAVVMIIAQFEPSIQKIHQLLAAAYIFSGIVL